MPTLYKGNIFSNMFLMNDCPKTSSTNTSFNMIPFLDKDFVETKCVITSSNIII